MHDRLTGVAQAFDVAVGLGVETNHSRIVTPATPAMTNDTILPFAFPAVRGRKITADFDGGRLTSDGGVMLLAMAERRLGIAVRLARLVPDRRDPTRVTHTLADMIRARIFAIAMGYEDADDLDHLRRDPAFKLAWRAPCPTAVATSARNRPCRVSRTRRACAT